MFWVLMVIVPKELIIGVLAGMREGSRTDRPLFTVSIVATATPEYVSGVILIALFATPLFGMQYFKGTATSAMDDITFNNFFSSNDDCVLRHGLHRKYVTDILD